MRRPHDRNNPTLLGVVLAVGLAFSGSTSWAQTRGDCVTSQVNEAFTLPDGSVHAAGRLTLCTVQEFTPAVGLHRVWTDDDGYRFLMSRLTRAETIADSRPAFLFRCDPGEPLDLVGYVTSSGRKSWSYSLRRSDLTGLAGPETFGAVRPAGEPVTPPPSKEN